MQRIVLTRPAVEAGERLGFLPGDLAQKVDPYLRPLYDALYDLMGYDRVTQAFEKATIEIAPLAFMRGRTLNHAFVILDEAQNTTVEQMKMFLTRLGFGSRAVVTGDVSQIDLPQGHRAAGWSTPSACSSACAASPSRTSAPPTWCAIRWWRASSRPTRRRARRARRRSRGHAARMTAARKPAALALSLQFADPRAPAAADAPPRRALAARRAGGAPAEITVRIVDAEEGQRLNREFRGKDYATNVLTFDYEREPVVQADLVLCAPVVEAEAAAAGRPLEAHYAHLLVHGALHAQGYDHEDDAEAGVMEARESELLRSLGYADPYGEAG